MKIARFVFAALAILVWLNINAFAEETQKPSMEPPKPSPEHEQLALMTGEWVGQIKSQCMSQNGQPVEGKGEYSVKRDLGGLFLVTEFKGMIGEMPFQGRGFNGYDPQKKKFAGVWIDSMSPYIYTCEGTFDKSTKTFNETMEGTDPTGKPMKLRSVTHLVDNNRMHFQMYAPDEQGKEKLMMEINYMRKK